MVKQQNLDPKRSLAIALFKAGAVQIDTRRDGGFKLKLHETKPNQPLSPIYLNLRVPKNKDGPLSKELVREIGDVMLRLIEKSGVKFNVVVGVPLSGEPFADFLYGIIESRGKKIGRIHLSKQKTAIGGRRISGVKHIGGTFRCYVRNVAILIDDLITGGESKLESIDMVRCLNVDVANLVVLIDRDQGGRAQLQEYGVETHTIFTLDELLAIYEREELISNVDLEVIQTYLKKYKKEDP